MNVECSPRPRRAFTLIELLVVIAIISLLTSILLPSLARARELAKGVVCRTNQHTIAQAVVLYGSEHEWRLPSSEWWEQAFGQQAEMYIPPMLQQNRQTMPKFLFCPADPDPYPWPYMADVETSSYAVNGVEMSGSIMSPGKRVALGLFGGDVSMDDIESVSDCFLLVESCNYDKIADLDHAAAIAAFEAAGESTDWGRLRYHHRATAGFYHDDATNVAYVDGHVASRPGIETGILPSGQWPAWKQWGYNGALFLDLRLPTADEEPTFWGPPYKTP